jgi:hypothetical protein
MKQKCVTSVVKAGDQIYFSFEKSEEGRLVLQTLRLGE